MALVQVKKTSSKKKGKKTNAGPGATALVYSGPSRLPRSMQQDDLMMTQINNAGALQTSAAGLLNTVFDAYSQMSTPADFASFQNLYTEYRILSMEIEGIPWNTFNMPTTNVLTPLYTMEDRANNSPVTSQVAAIDYESCKVFMPSKRWVRTIKMHSPEEAQWVAIGSSPATASRLYIKLYSAGNSNSITLYDFVARVLVQFRGRQ